MSLETIDFNRLNIRPGDRLLDLGCGEGRHSISAYLLADAEIVGLDLGLKDLKTAKERLTDFLTPPAKGGYCAFIQGTGHQLPFPDNAFDHVICSEVLEHIPDYPSFLREINRVLKPGGLFAVSVPRYFPEWVCWQLAKAITALRVAMCESSMHHSCDSVFSPWALGSSAGIGPTASTYPIGG